MIRIRPVVCWKCHRRIWPWQRLVVRWGLAERPGLPTPVPMPVHAKPCEWVYDPRRHGLDTPNL